MYGELFQLVSDDLSSLFRRTYQLQKVSWLVLTLSAPNMTNGVHNVPANHPDFIITVPIFDLQNLQKLGRPDSLEFQPVNISFFNEIFKT